MSVDVTNTACLDTEPLDKILASIPNVGSNDLVPILQQVQKTYGYLPKSILMKMSERTGIPASRIYGVATLRPTYRTMLPRDSLSRQGRPQYNQNNQANIRYRTG